MDYVAPTQATGLNKGMKSAYELAMDRLQSIDPVEKPLRPEQKAELADIDQRFRARLAEREIFLNQQLHQARVAQQREEIQQLEQQLRSERLRLEEEREAAKEKVRHQ